MLLNLFNEMRAAKVPVSVRELLDLINALKMRRIPPQQATPSPVRKPVLPCAKASPNCWPL